MKASASPASISWMTTSRPKRPGHSAAKHSFIWQETARYVASLSSNSTESPPGANSSNRAAAAQDPRRDLTSPWQVFCTSARVSLKNILHPAEQEVVREERRILNDLRASLIR